MPDLESLLERLVRNRVAFVVVGGFAAVAHGVSLLTERVSIWHAGNHDNPFGQRLTCLMNARKLPDSAVPMSLLADHPNVQFNYYRQGVGTCEVEMH
jgi:hypothetical protein